MKREEMYAALSEDYGLLDGYVAPGTRAEYNAECKLISELSETSFEKYVQKYWNEKYGIS